MGRSSEDNIDFFDIVARILQVDTFSAVSIHNLPRLRTPNVNISDEKNGSILE